MENVWAIICEKSSIDSQSNLLSLFNCIEEIKIEIDKEKMPQNDKIIIPINLQIISLWLVKDFTKDNSCEIKLELIDPAGKALNEFINVLQVAKGEKRMRNITNVQGLQITEEGRYYYKISQKKSDKFVEVAKLPLDVNLSYKIFDIPRQ